MEDKDIFRTAVFGGYQKEDVTDYIRSLENENETIRILANKEKSDLKTQLEKEKAVSEELKTSLAALHDKLSDLEKNQKQEPRSPAPPVPRTPDTLRQEEILKQDSLSQDTLKYSLEEERRALREDREQWAEHLTKMHQDMQSLWQNELRQLQNTLETIQSNLTQPAREQQPVPAPHTATDQRAPSDAQDSQALPHASDAPEAQQAAQELTYASATPDAKQDVQDTPSPAVPDASSAEMESATEESAALWQEEPQKAGYARKADVSINQTQKRISDLLLKLDNFLQSPDHMEETR